MKHNTTVTFAREQLVDGELESVDVDVEFEADFSRDDGSWIMEYCVPMEVCQISADEQEEAEAQIYDEFLESL